MSRLPQDPAYRIYSVGERAMAIQWGETVDEETNDHILRLFQWLKEKNIIGVADLIPAYQTLTLVYDPLVIRRRMKTSFAAGWLHAELETLLNGMEELPSIPSRQIEVPVCYDVSLGPDLAMLCKEKGLSLETLVNLHSKPLYRVYMIGFLPGFAYMGIVDERIAIPRKKEPVQCIAPGSVGIAGIQTGIYPLASPGGWHIIGRTPVSLFDPGAADPATLKGGDKVKFVPITLDSYHGYSSH